MADTLVQVDHLKKYFPLKNGLKKEAEFVRAVDDVSFELKEGETFGLVGESGSGKTTLAKMLLGLLPPTDGTITIDGMDAYSPEGRKAMHSTIGAVFQDPASSLNPRSTVYQSLERPLIIHGYSKKDSADLIRKTMEEVKLNEDLLDRFPHELSGGQQQRVSIARAIMLKSRLLVLDEPTSALDVSVQAQVLNQLLDLQQQFGLTYLFITHNLSVVRYMSDRICVMYGGKIMEIGEAEDVYSTCQHPYTMSLLSSVPSLHPSQRDRKKYLLTGDMPSLIGAVDGCRFASRCAFAREDCFHGEIAVCNGGNGHCTACRYIGSLEQN